MTLPQETIDKIKANAKAYMHNEIKGMVGDDELQPHHLQYAHEAGATEWAEMAQGLVEALQELVNLKEIKEQFGKTDEYLNNQPLAWEAAKAALAKYKEVSNV